MTDRILFTIPAEIKNGEVVLYFKQTSVPVPYGMPIRWSDEERQPARELSVNEESAIWEAGKTTGLGALK